MKALFLRTDFYGSLSVGGSFSHVKGFLDGLEQLGHSYVAVSSGDLPVRSSEQLIKVPYSSLFRNLPEVLSIAYNRTLLPALRTILRREQPDFLYHRHGEFNYASSVIAKEFRIPFVLECNGSEVWVKKQWGNLLFERILTLAEQIQFLAADVIMVVSEIIKEDLVRTGIPANKVVVNPNGVHPHVFHPDVDGSEIRKSHKIDNKIVAGFVGTFGAWHGIEVLGRAIKPAVARNPKVHFLIVGDGNLRGKLESIIRQDAVAANVTLTGSVPHSEIPKYLAACDMLLSPHVHNVDGTRFFGSPTKLFEYMSMEKPIIASGVGQIGDVIRDRENGLVMKEKDHNDLAAKILELADNASFRKRLGKAARIDVVKNYSWKRNAERVIGAVESLQHQ